MLDGQKLNDSVTNPMDSRQNDFSNKSQLHTRVSMEAILTS